MELSSLRIAGLVIGIIGMVLTFKIYRGPRWNRKNFVFFGIFSMCLIVVSINPDVLNVVAEILKLKREQMGRILALLIGSNILFWFLLFYLKSRLDEYRYQFDLLIRALGHRDTASIFKKEMTGKDIMVIVPAYNEAENLKSVLPRVPSKIKGKNVGVIVIDDGSSDGTKEAAEQMGHLAAQNMINRGQGAASRLGYDILLKNNIPYGVTMDADGQQLPEDIEKMVEPVLNDQYDLVIGSRILGTTFKNTGIRTTGVYLFTKIVNMATGLKLTDCSCGFKAFNVEKISKLNLREEQFQSTEVILEAAKKGLRIGEAPITVLERLHGTSKKGPDLRYGLFFAKTILKSWWR